MDIALHHTLTARRDLINYPFSFSLVVSFNFWVVEGGFLLREIILDEKYCKKCSLASTGNHFQMLQLKQLNTRIKLLYTAKNFIR